MSELPDTWATSTIGMIASQGQYGWTTKATHQGSVKYLRTTDITSGHVNWETVPYCQEPPPVIDNYRIQPGDIFISRAGSVGYNFLIENVPEMPAVFASYLIRFIPNSEISAKFLSHFLKSQNYWQQISTASAGIAVLNVNATKLAEVIVPLAPLNEQKRIADKLDSLLAQVDACQAHLDRVPQILKRFRQSVLAAAMSGRLTEKFREENSLDLSDWDETTVGEIADVFLGRQRSPENHYGEHMRKYVRAANVTWNGWNLSDVKEMNFNPQDFEKYRLRIGDVLLNEGSGSAGEVGKPAVWNGEIEDCCFQNTLICVRPYEASSEYLYFMFLFAAMSGVFIKDVRGLNIFHIGKEKLSSFRISLPTFDEQYEIVRRIEQLFALANRIEERWNAAQERIAQLTPSLLAKAFRGELVEQDPSDEPAAELLERIKKARENTSQEPKKSRWRTNMTAAKTEKDDTRLGIIQALEKSGKELSAQELFQLAGYPMDAESELVEEFFVEVREALKNKQIDRKRRNEMDWFSLLKQ